MTTITIAQAQQCPIHLISRLRFALFCITRSFIVGCTVFETPGIVFRSAPHSLAQLCWAYPCCAVSTSAFCCITPWK